jgi:methionyl-tRNA formyltransferase
MAGDRETGVDVVRMDAGLDTGPIAMREIFPILPEYTAGDLAAHLAPIAGKLSVSALQLLDAGLLEFREQSPVGACYAHKIERSEAEIDWKKGAENVRNQVHGLSPAPGAYSIVPIGSRDESIKFLRVEVTTGTGPPGTLLSEDMTVACGTGAIRVLQGQRPGKTVMSGRELMRGAKLARSAVFRQPRTPSSAPGA